MNGAKVGSERARAPAIIVSVGAHVAVLAWLSASVLPRLAPPPVDDVPSLTVELIRPDRLEPPMRPDFPPREAVVSRPAPVTALRLKAPALIRASPVPPSPLAPLLSPPAPPAPPAAARGPAAAPSSTEKRIAPAASQPSAGDLSGFLRATVGCSHDDWMRLSAAERARCDRNFARAAEGAGKLPLPTERLAAFATQADADARKRAGREGSLPNTLPACDPTMVGSNMMPYCLPKEAMHTVARF